MVTCAVAIGLLFVCIATPFVIVMVVIPKYFTKKCKSKVCLVGKTALVTGGSSGIGYEIVLGLAQRGCKVIVADKIINNNIKNKIIKETHNDEIYFEFIDLGSFKSVRSFAEKIKKNESKLDILIHNAGMGSCNGTITEDGLNLTMQVNFYSSFLLTHLLIDLLKKSSSGRLIFCSSPIVTTFLNYFILGQSMEKAFGDYKFSKFCVLAAADIFAEKLRSYNITSNSFHPGGVNTSIHQQFVQNKMILYLIPKLGWLVFKTPEDGAQTAIYLACANEVQNVTGKFFADLAPTIKPKDVENRKVCENIWEKAEVTVQLKKEELL